METAFCATLTTRKLNEPQSSIKIIGLHTQADGGGHKAVNHILKQAEQTSHTVIRVANKNRGLSKLGLLKLLDALITTRIRYQIPYVNLTETLENRLDTQHKQSHEVSQH